MKSKLPNRANLKVKQDFGKINPKAPVALSLFAFLVGSWRFKATVKLPREEALRFKGTWVGRYILDGYTIADEFRMTDARGNLLVLGVNVRSYDQRKRVWHVKWLNGLTGVWTDLTPSELGAVSHDGRSISYAFPDTSPVDDAHIYTRVTYAGISKTRFTWKGEKSIDGRTWTEFMVIICHRVGRSTTS
jgi:hypothetical protein